MQASEDSERLVRTEPGADLDLLAHSVIGAAIEVHRLLGPGFLEAVYEEALCIELRLRGIPFARQVVVALDYKGQAVGEGRLDLLIENSLIIELKAVDTLLPIHSAQLLSYLKMTGHPLGLLINFNVPILKYGIKRTVLSS
ncbi:MAG TPA: GxxExxY protein [Chloroflexia bacterium]|nr:GxxExxY protein [Chloroflexia bacterium]